MPATDLADEKGEQSREWAAKGHPHLAAWYQGQREAYLNAARLVTQEPMGNE